MKKLIVSPITRAICNKMLMDAVYRTALYPMADKANEVFNAGHNPIDDPIERAYSQIPTQNIDTERTYLSSPPGYGFVFPWPDPFTRYHAQCLAKQIEKGLDGAIIDQAVSHTKAVDRIPYKKCFTTKIISEAVNVYDKLSGVYFGDSSGKYLLCVTSRGRIETEAFTREGGGWEDEMIYMDYIDRPLYHGEYGRLKLDDRLYVVFLTTLDDRMRFNALLAPGALTVVPLENNLRAVFRRTPAGEEGQQPRGIDIGYEMRIGAVADMTRCVFFEATKAVAK